MSDRIKAVAIAEDKPHENFVLWVCDSYVQIVQQAAEMYMDLHENVTLNVAEKRRMNCGRTSRSSLRRGSGSPTCYLSMMTI